MSRKKTKKQNRNTRRKTKNTSKNLRFTLNQDIFVWGGGGDKNFNKCQGTGMESRQPAHPCGLYSFGGSFLLCSFLKISKTFPIFLSFIFHNKNSFYEYYRFFYSARISISCFIKFIITVPSLALLMLLSCEFLFSKYLTFFSICTFYDRF